MPALFVRCPCYALSIITMLLLLGCGRNEPAPVFYGGSSAQYNFKTRPTATIANRSTAREISPVDTPTTATATTTITPIPPIIPVQEMAQPQQSPTSEHFLDVSWHGVQPPQYIVQRGDTLYSIARRTNTSVSSLTSANMLKPPYTLEIGQSLRIPAAVYHTVQGGETLYGISRRYNTDMRSLATANNLQSPYTLERGQKLQIPAGATLPSQQQTTRVAAANRPAVVKQPALAAPPARAGQFSWPVNGEIIAGFGSKGNGQHNDGINIRVPAGSSVKAAENGVVAYADNQLKGYGNLILIRHKDGWITAYAHNRTLLVKRGETVRRGQVIAHSGSTGNVSTPQLHFEIRKGTRAVNPLQHLSKQQVSSR